MIVNIKDIFKASVCSFCENIYEYDSIDEKDFVKELKYFFTEDDLQDCLEACTEDVTYDIVNIDNICRDKLYILEYKKFDTENVTNNCINAFRKTLGEDKTINVEAFVDNLTNEFLKK